MKNTLRLFELLLAVYGFYVVTNDPSNPKPLVAMACIALIVMLDRWQATIIEIDERQKTPVAKKAEEGAKAKQQLEILRQSRSTALVSNAIMELIRDLGLTIRPSREHQAIDYLVELPDQAAHLGLKIIHDVDEPDQEWQEWQKIKEFVEGEGQHHFLLIAHNLTEDPESGSQIHVNFSDPMAKLLSQHQVTAMTSLSFNNLYQICKGSNQAPEVFFQRICQHQGGVFKI